jgi:2-methylisocitrate lyase-like PEP mutase family enzyme
MSDPARKRAAFQALHREGCFVIPNPWDVGSARMLQALGFPALASTSSGMAWASGRLDNEIPLEDALRHLTELAAAVDAPLNADFENGYADDPEGVAHNVRKALDTGIAGLSIEDMSQHPGKPLYDLDHALDRLRAARIAVDEDGTGAVLVARTEGMLFPERNLTQALDRLTAFAEAGADCLYAPGLRTRDEIAAAVRAVAPKPLNVLVGAPLGLTVSDLAELGVRRISLGGALARAAWAGFLDVARDIAGAGRFDGLASAAASSDLKALLRP